MSDLTVKSGCLAKEGKYLTFSLGKEDYGFEVLKVCEIIKLMDITAVPQVPGHVKGVINLRGKVIPIIDLRLKLGMPEISVTAETCIIVLNINEVLIGVIIDKVKDVLDINQKDLEAAPNFGSGVQADYVLGIGKVANTIKLLLNVEKMFDDDLALAGSISVPT